MAVLVILSVLLIAASAAAVFWQRRPLAIDAAISEFNRGEFESALEKFRNLILEDSANAEAQYYLALCHERTGDRQKALFHYNEVRKIGRFSLKVDRLEVYRKIADIYYTENALEFALEGYLDLLQAYPDDEHALSHAGFLVLGQGKFAAALPYLDKICRMKPAERSYQIARAVALFENGDDEGAIGIIENLLKENSSDQELILLLILTGSRARVSDSLERIENFFFQETRDHVRLLLLRGYVEMAFRTSKFEKAISFLEKVLKQKLLEALDLEARYFQVLFLMNQERYREADAVYADLMSKKPDYRGSKQLDLYIKMRNKNYDSSEIPPFREIFTGAFRNLLPEDLVFRISGLAMKERIPLQKFWNDIDENPVLKPEFAPLTVESALEIFSGMTAESMLEFAQNACYYFGYKPLENHPAPDGGGVDIAGLHLATRKGRALIAVRRFKDGNISDVYLENLSARAARFRCKKTVLIANAPLSDSARAKLRGMRGIEVPEENALMELFRAVPMRRAAAES